MMTVFAAKERVPASTNDGWISCLLCAQNIASLPPFVSDEVRGHSQMTSEERGREGVGQYLTIGREVAWIWY